MNIDDDDTGETLELEVEVPEFEEEESDVVIAFADDETEEEPELVKKLRDQIRDRDRKLAQFRRAPVAADDDPEPLVPDEPSEDDAGWDFDKFREAMRAREKAVLAHADWKARQTERDNARNAAQARQSKRVEQQKNALGAKDYDAKIERVKEALSPEQLAVIINAAENPAKLLYALGGSEARLAELAGEENLARVAGKAYAMEGKITMGKKTAPAPETMVRGATGTLSHGTDKHLERLEKEAERTGDRSAVQKYKRSLKQRAA